MTAAKTMRDYVVGDDLITASTDAELVRKMHKLCRAQAETDKQFMEQFAQRMMLQSNQKIRSDTPAHFVDDLKVAGRIQVRS
jgi:hypothetical protein